jgi:transposase, IS5 family
LYFRNTYLTVLLSGYLGRELSKSSKKIWGKLQSQLDALGLQIKQGLIQDTTFIHSDPGRAKAENLKKMRQKHEEAETGHG